MGETDGTLDVNLLTALVLDLFRWEVSLRTVVLPTGMLIPRNLFHPGTKPPATPSTLLQELLGAQAMTPLRLHPIQMIVKS